VSGNTIQQYANYNPKFITKEALLSFIEENNLQNAGGNIESVFLQCDNSGIFGSIVNNGQLEDAELKQFIKSLAPNVAELIKTKFLAPLANNEIIETIGKFQYTSLDKSEQLKQYKTFDNALKKQSYKIENRRYLMFEKLAQMLKNGEISFDGGLSEKEMDYLFKLSPDILENLVNKNIDIQSLLFEASTEFSTSLLNGDYSKLADESLREIDGSKQLFMALDEFKSKKGISLYDHFIQCYENNEMAKDEFLTNMTNLLKSCRASMPNFVPDDIMFLDADFEDLYSFVETGDDVELDAFKQLDFDKYIDEIFIPDVFNFLKNDRIYKENKAQYDKLQQFNLEGTKIANLRPEITNVEIAANKKIQTFNGVEYSIELNENSVTVTNASIKETYTINLDKMLANISSDKDKAKVKDIILALNAPVLIDLCQEVDTIEVYYEDSSVLAAYHSDNNIIKINLFDDQLPPEKYVRGLTHEIGHSLDFSNRGGDNISWAGKDSTFLNIAEKELEALKSRPDYEKQYASSSPLEMFSECYTLLMTGKSCSSDFVLATYFPETLKFINEHLDELRAIPLENRHYYKEGADEIIDFYNGIKYPQWNNFNPS